MISASAPGSCLATALVKLFTRKKGEGSHHVRPDGPGLARGEVLHQDGAVVASPPLDLSLTQNTAQWSHSQEWFTLEPVILVYLAHTSRVKAVMVRLAMAPPSN